MTIYLMKKCLAIVLRDWQWALLQLHELPTDMEGLESASSKNESRKSDVKNRSKAAFTQRGVTVELPFST